MPKPLTKPQRKALLWLAEQADADRERFEYPRGRTASGLADYMWPKSAQRRSNSGGYGSQAGVGVNLKAGAWLERLRKAGLVRDVSMTAGLSLWVVTEAARKALAHEPGGSE